ncbi:MAG: hypothetical protein C0594_02535, partial [Marinilabiliales bacterium]
MDKGFVKKIDDANQSLFSLLKEKGMERIQNYCGEVWTDYNEHDPGITILEYLCYALTELIYKSRNSVSDILAEKTRLNAHHSGLFPAHKILSSHPLTELDFRRLILDIPDVKNARIIPIKEAKSFKGICKVEIELYHSDYYDPTKRKILADQVFNRFSENRNLCEVVQEVNILEYENVAFNIDIEVDSDLPVHKIYRDVLIEIDRYLSPEIAFFSLKEMLDKNYSPAEIFNGPLLENGFLDAKQLEHCVVKKEIHTSDIITAIMSVPGVKYIKNIDIIDIHGHIHKWRHEVKANHVAHLNIKDTNARFFNSSGAQLNVEKKPGEEIFPNKFLKSSAHKLKEFTKIEGEYIELSDYYSFQNDFPQAYGIGMLGVPPNSSRKRVASARQLKAYLLLFDQVFQNFHEQLENLKSIFSLDEINRSYFVKPVLSMPAVEYIYLPFINDCITNNVD